MILILFLYDLIQDSFNRSVYIVRKEVTISWNKLEKFWRDEVVVQFKATAMKKLRKNHYSGSLESGMKFELRVSWM
jgi:hypothetical protein